MNASARQQLLLSTAMLAAFAAYGRRAYAACDPQGGGTYECSGANIAPQIINANDAIVTTVPGFSVDTTTGGGGTAITITGDGALSYTDANASPLTSTAGRGLYVWSYGNSGNPGSVTIDTDGAVDAFDDGIFARSSGDSTGAIDITTGGTVTSSTSNGIRVDSSNYASGVTITTGAAVSGDSYGIFADNNGLGDLTITANGDVTGSNQTGIFARNQGTADNLTVTTYGAVTGADFGVYADNDGSGDTTVAAYGDVTGTNNHGIYAYTGDGDNITVTTGAGTTVTGYNDGVRARNFGDGATAVTAYGDVTGQNGYGIYAYTDGTDVTVTTYGTVTGSARGIRAYNRGTGAVSVAANGDVTGGGNDGIYAYNSTQGTSLTVTTAAGTAVMGGLYGINARSFGSGAATIIADGDVSGTNFHGIYAGSEGVDVNSGISLSITAENVSGGYDGIHARNYGTGMLTITTNGDVTGDEDGVYALSDQGGPIEITVNAGSTVTGTSISSIAIDTFGGATHATIAGTLTAPLDAVVFDQTNAVNDRLELHPTFVINGRAFAGPGTDTLAFAGMGDGAFDLADIDTGTNTQQYQDFENFDVDSGVWTFSDVTAAGFDVNGGTAKGTGTFGDVTLFAGGTIAPGNSIGTMTVDGDFTSEGGVLEVEVELGDDSSPTDLLVITGNALLGAGGPTDVQVINLGGLGAQTSNGIRIVEVQGATSEAGVFTLAAPVIAGAYFYDLFQGGVDGVGDPNDGDWYLRSSDFAPTAAIYEAYPAALIGLIDLPTLRQRVGDRHWPAVGGSGSDLFVADGAMRYRNSLWTRIEGAQDHVEGDSTADASYDASRYLVQIGIDGQFADNGGVLIGGLNLQYARSEADISAEAGDGDSATDSYGGGATLTWYGEDGAYADGQATVAYLLSDLGSDDAGDIVEDNQGWGYAVSLEAGRIIPLGGGLSVTPQAQLTYASVDFDDFADPFGGTVSLDSGDSLKGRIGVAIDVAAVGAMSRGHVYTIANLIYEFLDGATVSVDADQLAFAPDALAGEAGVGGTYEWAGGRYAIHGEALARGSLDGGYGFKGTAGLRATW